MKNDERPELNIELDGQTFRNFYYLKEELVAFCREYNLPVTGGKIEFTNIIAHFLDTGEIIEASSTKKKNIIVGTMIRQVEKQDKEEWYALDKHLPESVLAYRR